MQKKHILLGLCGLLIVVGIVLSVRITGEREQESPDTATSTSQGNVQVTDSGVAYSYGYASSTVATSSPVVLPKQKAPDLTRSILIPERFEAATASATLERMKSLIAALKEKPGNAALWANLGLERKGIEDYTGSRDAYEYSYALSPNNAITIENLGVLYGYYLEDLTKAEKYFLEAIELEPEALYRYLRLFEFYQYLVKDIPKARAILERGLKISPDNPSFKALLESL